MSAPILATKLYIPPPRPDLVPRTRLIAQLNASLTSKLTLVSAPAGFGKSTLLSSWVSQSESEKISWLSLDDNDNDLSRFLAYFVASLQTINNKIGGGVLEVLQSPGAPNSNFILTTLLNEIIEYAYELVIVLDDYHVIIEKSINQALLFLLDHLPSNLHLIIATRIDPPVPLAGLRARGQMIELRTADLRFTQKETDAFLNQLMDLNLSAEDISTLETRTEGWVAGLQMAAVSMRYIKDTAAFISDFAGDHRHIVDYLVEEVLNQCTQELRDFLLQTSILEQMSAPLCNALTGKTDAQTTLIKLEQDNLFTIPLDQKRGWYRYHHLFRDLLLHRLTQKYPERIETLHARASLWLAENDFPNQAIKLALAMEDKLLAADLIKRYARDLLHLGTAQVKDMLGWFEYFSEEMLRKQPLLQIYRAWTLVYTNPFKYKHTIEQMLDQIQDSMQDVDVDVPVERISGHIASIRGLLSQPPIQTPHDPQKTLALFHQAIQLFPEDEVRVRCGIHLGIAYEHMHLENSEAALEANQNAYAEALAANNQLVAIVALRNQVMIRYYTGQLSEAIEHCQSNMVSLDQIFSENNRNMLGLEILSIALAFLLVERGELEKAEFELTEGLDALELFNEYEAVSLGYIAWLRVLLLRGEKEKAREELEKFRRRRVFHADLVEILKIQIALSDVEGNTTLLDTLKTWLQANQPEFEAVSDFRGITPWDETRHLAYMTWIQAQVIIFAQGSDHPDLSELQSCLDYLERRIQTSEQHGLVFRIIECSVLKALVLDAMGKTEEATDALTQALVLAAPEGFQRVFMDKGHSMNCLLQMVSKQDAPTNFVLQLIDKFERSGDVKSELPVQNLIDPLSARELEVLRSMAEGLTYNEIASQIMVSLNTVRTHVKNIYSKLNVHKRSQAIAKAKELNIL
jgi:LuxR family maltose regulon positive regulatory protein